MGDRQSPLVAPRRGDELQDARKGCLAAAEDDHVAGPASRRTRIGRAPILQDRHVEVALVAEMQALAAGHPRDLAVPGAFQARIGRPMGGAEPCPSQRQRCRLEMPLLGEIVVAESGKIALQGAVQGVMTGLGRRAPGKSQQVQCIALDCLAKYHVGQTRSATLRCRGWPRAPPASRIAAVCTARPQGKRMTTGRRTARRC